MAIFNDLKGRFADADQTAIQKTQEFSEVAKLESKIESAQEKMNGLYGEIGRAVYASYADQPLPEVADLFSQVAALQEEIEKAQAQIKAINSANTCPSCGAKVDKNDLFCSECGAKIVRDKPNNTGKRICVSCGSPISPNALFCRECGAKQPQQPNNGQPSVKICSHCGAEMPPDSIFCAVCGNRID